MCLGAAAAPLVPVTPVFTKEMQRAATEVLRSNADWKSMETRSYVYQDFYMNRIDMSHARTRRGKLANRSPRGTGRKYT